jgi:hypothetical protein
MTTGKFTVQAAVGGRGGGESARSLNIRPKPPPQNPKRNFLLPLIILQVVYTAHYMKFGKCSSIY